MFFLVLPETSAEYFLFDVILAKGSHLVFFYLIDELLCLLNIYFVFVKSLNVFPDAMCLELI